MATSSPIYDPGDSISCRATGAAVTGGRILKVTAAKADGGNVPVQHCGASDVPFGAAGSDAVDGALTQSYGKGFVLPLDCAANVDPGVFVEVTTAGKVQNYSSGTKVGVSITAGTTSVRALVKLI